MLLRWKKKPFDYFLHNAGSPNDVIDGGIIVFAAGNEYAAMAGYPGAYPDYISVAALAADGTPSCYSNYAMGVSIAAPVVTVIIIRARKEKYIPHYLLLPMKMVGKILITDIWKEHRRLVHIFRE